MVYGLVILVNDKQPRFALYTGTEEEEEKELMRNIYNGDWELIPSTLRAFN